MARHSDNPPTFALELRWDEVGKRWKLIYWVQVGKGRGYHWQWVETDHEIDAWTARALARAVVRELHAFIF